MRVIFLIISVLFLSLGAKSQHHHFFYIQSDQQQPFYIKLGKEVLSSSSGGFLIIPKLKDSAYEMIVGFPKNQFPEYLFKIPQVKKDRGLTLKNFGEKGWGLFDMQSMEIQMGEKIFREETKSARNVPPVTNDAFTAILASVIDDPGLMGTELVRTETVSNPMARNAVVKDASVPKPVIQNTGNDPVKINTEKKEILVPKEVVPVVVLADAKSNPIPANDSLVTKEAVALHTETVSLKNEDSIKTLESPAGKVSPHIDKVSELQLDSTMELVFADHNIGGETDTIRVILKCQRVNQDQAELKDVNQAAVEAVTISKPPEVISEKKPAEIILPPETVVEKVNTPDTTLTVTRKNTRAACKRVAQDKEVTALRRRMVALKDEDDMVTVALKDFKVKCYTTEQVRNISFVFVRDEGRYKLLDAAYPYVYDQDAFPTLESLLSDPYFIHRFRALLKTPLKPVP